MKTSEREAGSADPEVENRPEEPDTGLEQQVEDRLPSFTLSGALKTMALIAVLVVGIYFFVPRLVGVGDAIETLGDAHPVWVAVALAFGVLSFGTYIALFRAVVGGDVFPIGWREAYEINMAAFAATRLFSAGGAGGVALTYWALRQGGMERRDVGTRMVAFLALQYLFYPLAVVVFGVLLTTGVLNGSTADSLTIVPAAIALVVMVVGLAIALVPSDIERRITRYADRHPSARYLPTLAKVPATVAEGVREALHLVAHPTRAGLAVLGAIGYWAANIGILWASFKALGIAIPFGVVVMGFFIGMTANLIPFAPAGVGAVDAGMIGTFVLFGFPEAEVFAAILIYRLVAFWLPIPFGIVAFFQLRNTIRKWKQEGLPIDRPPQPSLLQPDV